MLVEGELLEEQLRQVWAEIGPPPEAGQSRCPVCNGALSEAAAELVAERLPRYVQQTQKHDVPLTLCGEMAGRPLDAMALLATVHRISSRSDCCSR